MSGSRPEERAVIEQVATHFSATSTERVTDSADACLGIDGRRVAVRVATIGSVVTGRGDSAAPRLRFDKVALRWVARLQDALCAEVADGRAVMFTVTAPIRLPSKTAAELERVIRQGLAREPSQAEIGRSGIRKSRGRPSQASSSGIRHWALRDAICTNAIRVRFVEGVAERAAKLIGFVHNPESDPAPVLDLAEALLRCIGAAADRAADGSGDGDRWLVIADQAGLASIETYRQVHSQLGLRTGVDKTLLLLRGERLETLVE